jgi:hypothetical protein
VTHRRCGSQGVTSPTTTSRALPTSVLTAGVPHSAGFGEADGHPLVVAVNSATSAAALGGWGTVTPGRSLVVLLRSADARGEEVVADPLTHGDDAVGGSPRDETRAPLQGRENTSSRRRPAHPGRF